MKYKYLKFISTLAAFLTIYVNSHGNEQFKKPNVGYTDIEKLKSGTEPFFEVWDEDNA